jgi:hypothetical protein
MAFVVFYKVLCELHGACGLATAGDTANNNEWHIKEML